MRTIMLSFCTLGLIILFSCNTSNSNHKRNGFCFDSTFNVVYSTNDSSVIILKKKTVEPQFDKFSTRILSKDAIAMVQNYQNEEVKKSIYVDFDFKSKVLREFLDNVPEDGAIRIYFGAYKFNQAPNPAAKYEGLSTAILVPLDKSRTEIDSFYVNLGNLCPPECARDANGKFPEESLAGKAGLK